MFFKRLKEKNQSTFQTAEGPDPLLLAVRFGDTPMAGQGNRNSPHRNQQALDNENISRVVLYMRGS
jgi:hypothetical protein